ncbi:M36 family metallopeptidase [Lewinella cohaerens]|uniref:M36 family metallopeptidase n=1 Tax=Lewinella cohaerens TaxID=70995 RepID=UPI00037F41E7|nr:M36 family metallopeptidase [Lewinella cohaerens]
MIRSATLLLLLLCIFMVTPLVAQQQTEFQKATLHLEQRATEWGLQTADIMDIAISDEYVSKHNGARHFYFMQQYAGIPVYGAINGVHLSREAKVIYATNTFEPNLAERVNALSPVISPKQALQAALEHLGLPAQALVLKERTGDKYTFSGGDFAHNDVTVQLRYMPLRETGIIHLAWDMAIDVFSSADYWSLRIDALDGKILHKYNYTVYCTFDNKAGHTSHAGNCTHESTSLASAPMHLMESMIVTDGAGYNVIPLPTESPLYGERQLLFDPSNPTASPFGWHDTNGEEGAEYTITRGNNVHAYLDAENINSSNNDEPDGTDDLLFDFYFDPSDEPENMQESGVTQLFYTNNMMHDIFYRYGFDEQSGNFQEYNYTGEGEGLDYVMAEAQDGNDTNNANFMTPPDGEKPRMQMYRWFGVEGSVLSFFTPESIAGSYDAGTAQYGPSIPEAPISAEVIRAFDESGTPYLVCQDVANANAIAGKIALIDRGDCLFEEKTNNAEAAGAVAVIICNYEETTLSMGDGVNGSDPSIITINMKASDCNAIKLLLDQGEVVTASIGLPAHSGPASVGSSMDNSVITHEYAHGISTRLTGGPFQVECLENDEQMGEGWSDFFALITTIRPDDTGATRRTIGNYAARQPTNGNGIRRMPYSTDFAINNQDMDDIIATTRPHDVGEVWASAIWDLYWEMADIYGFDADVTNGTGGNNMAIQLVMDGMKLQRCNPGLLDGRDALLSADSLNYDGIHGCLIWEVFARRGMGIDADQNDRFDRNDNEPGFTTVPSCIKELKIRKSADRDLILAGEAIEYTIVVTNDKEEAVTGVMVEDELPAGLTYQTGSAIGATATDNGNNVTFDIGDLATGENAIITYIANASASNRSVQLFYDDMEEGDDNWEFEANSGFDIWDLSSSNPNSGSTSWFVRDVGEQNDQLLILNEPFEVNGTNPSLRFYHDYDTEPVADGGLVEVSTNDGASWEKLPNSYIRNGYRGDLAAQTLFSPGIQAFWGDSQGYKDSYIDLSAYQGQTIKIRFRFASNFERGGTGWYVDDVELMDKVAYEGEACVSSNEGDSNCAGVPQGGVIVDTEFVESTENPVYDPQVMQVYPNPASHVLNVAITLDLASTVDVQLINAGGAVVRQWRDQALQGRLMSLNISELPAGFYFLQMNTQQGIYTQKVTIQ